MDSCVILIPVKGFAVAKQRLSPVLDPAERCALATAMLDDVLGALAAWPRRPGVAVVTGDHVSLQMARRYGFDIIEDRKCAGETEAIRAATEVCVGLGVASALVIPGDVPLVTAAELEAVLGALPAPPAPGTVLVPAADGRGTNAAFRRPADLFPLRFGNDSFQPHWSAAQATGRPCSVLRLPGIGLDVDSPADLEALLRAPMRTASQHLLFSWKVGQRLAAGAALAAASAIATS
jgi:2-phospho-L-lactate guanylyltransferase